MKLAQLTEAKKKLSKIDPWMKIIEEGITQKKEVFEVQDELLDAGYKAQAKL